MAEEQGDKIYILGSKLNNVESLIVTKDTRLNIVAFETLDMAKSAFKSTYDMLLAPTFTPSQPPSDQEMKYHSQFMRLIHFYPVFLGIDKKSAPTILEKWKDGSQHLFQPRENYCGADYWHLPMRPGFFKEFVVLDIAKDIETTPFVGPDGKMVIRVNKMTFNGDGGNLRNLTPEEIDEALRKRGYR